MSFDVVQSVQQIFTDFLGGIFGSEERAAAFLRDPNGELTAAGLDNRDLSSLNVQQAVVDACDYPGVPPSVKEHLSSYSAPSYANQPPTIENVVQQVQQVTQVVYQDNSVVNEITNNNNTNIDVGDNFSGDIDVDNNNANILGDGVATAGNNNDVNAAVGGGNVLDNEDGTINGNVNQNTGDGAVQAGDDINAPVNTGTFTGVQTDNLNAEDSVFNFGGDVNQANDNTGPVAQGGGDALEIDDSNLQGVGIATDAGDATGNFQDNDETTNVNNSNDVNTEQGDGNQDIDEDQGREIAPIL
jgi:hypothetical protein